MNQHENPGKNRGYKGKKIPHFKGFSAINTDKQAI
jgi:hypothetical protein